MYRYRASWHRHSTSKILIERFRVVRETQASLWLDADNSVTLHTHETQDTREDWEPPFVKGSIFEVLKPTPGRVSRTSATVQDTPWLALQELRRRTRTSYRIRHAIMTEAERRCMMIGADLPKLRPLDSLAHDE